MLNSRLRIMLICLLISLCLTVSGCWDRKEIENRGYVLGIAIDYVQPTTENRRGDIDRAVEAAGRRKYRVTFEMPKFRKSIESQEVSSGQSHFLWSGEGESMFAITRMIGQKTYFSPFFEDIQAMIFSEEVAREGIGDILDFWLRDAEMRRRLRLFIAPGRAEDILKTKSKVEEVNSMFIGKLTQNVNKSPFFASKADIGMVSQQIRNGQSFTIPMIIAGEDEFRVQNTAVFDRHQRMVGTLEGLEVLGAKILRENLKEGIVVVSNPVSPEKIVNFEIYEPKIKMDVEIMDEHPVFKVDFKVVGHIGENQAPEQDALDNNFSQAVENAVAEEFVRDIRMGYEKQQTLHADVCELGALLRRKYPDYWKNIKDRWDDEIFPAVPLEVNVKVTVRRPVNTR